MAAAFVVISADVVRDAVLPHMANILAITPSGSAGLLIAML